MTAEELNTISVVIASFGGPEWMELARGRAFSSTLEQRGGCFHEVIVKHEPDMTLAQVRNAGAKEATGQWLLFLDADDELDPHFAAHMKVALEREPTRPALFTPAVCYARRNVRPQAKIWPRMDFKVGNWCVIGTLIERDLFHKLGGFREYLLYEDYALWAMAGELGVQVFEVPKAIYVAHYSRLSRNRSRPQERLYWHQRIGRDIWPDHFEDLTPEEDGARVLQTSHLRFAA